MGESRAQGRQERLRELARGVLAHRPGTPEALHRWIRVICQLHVPRRRFCAGHVSPFDYLCRSFFDERDMLIWANRGGGKTTMAALACLLDGLFRGRLTAAVLAGSFDQSDRLVAHLRKMLRPYEGLLEPRWFRERLEVGEASVLTLSQSQRAVRGLRVQKLRCDELDLFDRDVWRAAQFVTQSTEKARGSLEGFSTLHRAGGLMDELIGGCGDTAGEGVEAGEGGFELMRWCLWEVIERCGPERKCERCALAEDCGGKAREGEGFFRIDDAIAIKLRASRAAWESEMLCMRPRAEGLVFEEFRREVHVRALAWQPDWPTYRAMDFGYANPFVCLWLQVTPGGCVHVLDEYIQSRRSIDLHAREVLARERRAGIERVQATYVDPAGKSRELSTGWACTEMLAGLGIECTSRASAISDGLELIRAHLCPAEGPARLMVDPRCKGLVRSFETYHYAEKTGIPAKDGPDHALDALRYFFVNRMTGRGKVMRGRY